MRTATAFCLFAPLGLAPSWGQAASLNVTVVNSSGGSPVVGAQVFVGEDGRGTVYVTDASGQATVETSSTSRLTITATLSTTERIVKRPVVTTTATTLQNVSGSSVIIPLGPYQFASALATESVPTETHSGVVTGLDATIPGGWAVRSSTSSTSATIDETTPAEPEYFVAAPVGAAPFLYAAQLEAGEDGTWSSLDVPSRYGLVLDAPAGAAIPLTSSFDVPGAITARGVEAGTDADTLGSVCAGLTLEVPGGRGQLEFNLQCLDLEAGEDVATVATAAPSLSGPLAGGSYGFDAVAANGYGGQFLSRSGFTSAIAALDLPPMPAAVDYQPLLLSELPGTSIAFTGDEGANREVLVFSEGHLGPGGYMHSVTTWTVVNADTSDALTFPRIPRGASLPALGARLPDIGNQTAVIIAEHELDGPQDFALSYAYLDTWLPPAEPPEDPTTGRALLRQLTQGIQR